MQFSVRCLLLPSAILTIVLSHRPKIQWQSSAAADRKWNLANSHYSQ